MSLLPLARGRRWPTGRMRGLTWSKYDEEENSELVPLTLALSPVENVYSWKINCGGRGDNRKQIHSFISDRVKYRYRRGLVFAPILSCILLSAESDALVPRLEPWNEILRRLFKP